MELMKQPRSNIILIGMPGAGKSTVGVILAKLTARDFVDTDLLIQTAHGRPLQDIVDKDGYIALRRAEEEILLGLAVQNHVIATGGSAVYSDPSMQHLKENGIVVFLDVSLAVLESRVGNYSRRGLAKRPDQSFEELFEERSALYLKYADITLKCDNLTMEQVCDGIIKGVKTSA